MGVFIYGLVDPESNEIKYVGKTNNMKRRLYQHLQCRTDQKMTPVKSWIKSLLSKNNEPLMVVIEECSDKTWMDREKFWIAKLPNLKNMAEGGNEPHCPASVRKANAKKLNQNREKGIHALLKHLGQIVLFYKKQGNENKIQEFKFIQRLVKSSTGSAREKYNNLGLRFANG